MKESELKTRKHCSASKATAAKEQRSLHPTPWLFHTKILPKGKKLSFLKLKAPFTQGEIADIFPLKR